MRALLQRVSHCRVSVDGREVSRIGPGLLVLLGVSTADDERDVDFIVGKVVNLRIFDDAEGKLNLSLAEVGGEVMVVSQFTLYGDARKGRRPSYIEAAPPERARELFEKACDRFAAAGFPPDRGVFQAHMEVELVNDGPVTILLESPQPA
ncbi:MAG: D-tyrosyl-tRNA(Tyr) deacylase [Actinobacteria bacterium]|jgi:D-tyrosyl-tRNA(Tyr) deacylase|nr:MAG: D-tyrosyl-tRNA(Tyr) deacylase [Actinomycetota bacterium]